uniref:AAA+ ATPase At3g28540-like C-terminal domain-containing protein n=1 Tax=Opuntia streptacantha TaxID=393608 RepID=A0A7C9DV83_OPUST
MDGVVSGCGEERIMVFTMNCKQHIDPLVLRPGRVDVHIYFPLCDFSGFKSLALSHLGIKDHKLFGQVEDLFQNGSRLSPAEISEIMISNRTSPTRAMKLLITTLESSGDVKELDKVQVQPRLNGSGRERASDDSDGSGSGNKRESVNAIREIQKFYGLLKLKNSKKEDSTDHLGTS